MNITMLVFSGCSERTAPSTDGTQSGNDCGGAHRRRRSVSTKGTGSLIGPLPGEEAMAAESVWPSRVASVHLPIADSASSLVSVKAGVPVIWPRDYRGGIMKSILSMVALCAIGLLLSSCNANQAGTSRATTSIAGEVREHAPKVVSIRVPRTSQDSASDQDASGLAIRPAQSVGSGILFKKEGKTGNYVITNTHVVRDIANPKENISLLLFPDHPDRHECIVPAGGVKLIGMDSFSDIAVLHYDLGDGLDGFCSRDHAYDLDSKAPAIKLADPVFVIGYPGEFGHTVTSGIVSSLARVVGDDRFRYLKFITTDAVANLGNSGGALINQKGELLGVIAGMQRIDALHEYDYTIAVPIDVAKNVALQLIAHGEVRRGRLPFEIHPSRLFARTKQPDGESVMKVYSGPAGVVVGEVIGECCKNLQDILIVKIDGNRVYDKQSYDAESSQILINSKVTITYCPKDWLLQKSVKFQPSACDHTFEIDIGEDGMKVEADSLSPLLKVQRGVEFSDHRPRDSSYKSKGVEVVQVYDDECDNNPSARALCVGDVIRKLNITLEIEQDDGALETEHLIKDAELQNLSHFHGTLLAAEKKLLELRQELFFRRYHSRVERGNVFLSGSRKDQGEWTWTWELPHGTIK